jgi:2-polyprenyl-6-methoxyphenol hydroxylase-like FAD-dependent oxidoreductase
VAFHSLNGERLKGPLDFAALMSKNLKEAPKRSYRHSRPKFHGMLLTQLSAIGVEVEYGKEVVDYFEDAASGKGGVVLKDGSCCTADLVVAADGGRGVSYKLVAGHPVPACTTGRAIYRVAYPVEIALEDAGIAERFPLLEDGRSVIEIWNGPDINCVFWRNEDEMSWAITRLVRIQRHGRIKGD